MGDDSNDELEDLFGAFDGDDDPEEEQPVKKQARLSNGNGNGSNGVSKKEKTSVSVQKQNDPRKKEESIPQADGNVVKNGKESNKVGVVKSTEGQSNDVKNVNGSSSTSATNSTTTSSLLNATNGSESSVKQSEGRAVSTGTADDKSVRSYSALPPNYVPVDLDRSKPPAKKYPYQLDPFQVMATESVEKGESVLVAAHTSAGKTTVAEYAVAKSLRDGQRVIYTRFVYVYY